MVPFGIKVTLWHCDMVDIQLRLSFHIGESNVGNLTYACTFAKMIEYWRQIWNERTNGSTDIQFPFGFVQVKLHSYVKRSYESFFNMFIVIDTHE
jgi:hypothetical protein